METWHSWLLRKTTLNSPTVIASYRKLLLSDMTESYPQYSMDFKSYMLQYLGVSKKKNLFAIAIGMLYNPNCIAIVINIVMRLSDYRQGLDW
jgi:hypothetical protein